MNKLKEEFGFAGKNTNAKRIAHVCYLIKLALSLYGIGMLIYFEIKGESPIVDEMWRIGSIAISVSFVLALSLKLWGHKDSKTIVDVVYIIVVATAAVYGLSILINEWAVLVVAVLLMIRGLAQLYQRAVEVENYVGKIARTCIDTIFGHR